MYPHGAGAIRPARRAVESIDPRASRADWPGTWGTGMPRDRNDLEPMGGEELFLPPLRSSHPDLSDTEAREIAVIWADELDQIIARLLALSKASVGATLPIQARPTVMLELSNLILFIASQMAKRKLQQDRLLEPLTAHAARRAVESTTGKQRIEDTARILADHVWDKRVAHWRKLWPLIIDPVADEPPVRASRRASRDAPAVRNNHFSPVFSHKPWASTSGLVRELSRGLDGQLRHRDISYRVWGRDQYLYSLPLERNLALVDDDAAKVARKLLDLVPLADIDKRRWIAFLIVQLLRSPAFMLKLTRRTESIIPTIDPLYPTTPAALKAAYETLFTNNDVYAHFHRLIAPLTWRMLAAPSGTSFIRPDATILAEGSVDKSTWRLAYPLTPEKVFIVEPGPTQGYDQAFVPTVALASSAVMEFNQRLSAVAFRSVLVRPESDSPVLRAAISNSFGSRAISDIATGEDAGLWGPLS